MPALAFAYLVDALAAVVERQAFAGRHDGLRSPPGIVLRLNVRNRGQAEPVQQQLSDLDVVHDDADLPVDVQPRPPVSQRQMRK